MLFGTAKKESNRSVEIIQEKVGGLDKYPAFVFTLCQEPQRLALRAPVHIHTYRLENSPLGSDPWARSGRSLWFEPCGEAVVSLLSQPGGGRHPRGASHRGHRDAGAGRSPDGQEEGDCEEAAHSRNLG